MNLLKKIFNIVVYVAKASYNFAFGSIVAVAKNEANAHDVIGAAARFAAVLVVLFGLSGVVATAITTYVTLAFYIFAFRTALGVLTIATEGQFRKFKVGVFFNESTYSWTF